MAMNSNPNEKMSDSAETSLVSARPVRVVIQQPALPKYRVALFAELAKRPGISVHVSYGQLSGFTNAPAEGFSSACEPASIMSILGRELVWSSAQLRYASKDYADVLVLTWNLNYASLVPTLLRAKAAGVATVLWGHGFSKVDSPLRSWPRRNVVRLASAALFYTPKIAEQNIAAGLPREKTFVAINSLDDRPINAARAQWAASPGQLDAFKAQHQLSPGPTLVFVSRLTPKARLDLLLQSARALVAEFPSLRILVVGGGDIETYRAQAAGFGLESHVIFAGAIYSEAELAPYFLAADVFVYPSRGGLSFIHAMAYGVPVVTDDALHLHGPEIDALLSAQAGILYKHQDAADLTRAIRELLADPDRRGRMSRSGLACVASTCNLKNMTDGFEAAIRYARGTIP